MPKKNELGEYEVFFNCPPGSEDDCLPSSLYIRAELEEAKWVMYFRAYDDYGSEERRGNVAVPIDLIYEWYRAKEEDETTELEYNDFGYLRIDPVEEWLYMSTGPHGDFSMPFETKHIKAVFSLMWEVL